MIYGIGAEIYTNMKRYDGMTSRERILSELMSGNDKGYSHMMVVCDTFSYDDYFVFVKEDEDIRKEERKYNKNMQKVMEIYSYSLPLLNQMKEFRAFHR